MIDRQTHFLTWQCLSLCVCFVLLWTLFPVGGHIDRMLIQPYINQHGEFNLKHSWALAELGHHYIKNLLILVYLLIFLGWMASFQLATWRARRWELGYFFVMVIIGTSLIGLIKSQSAHACPWSMLTYSGHGWVWDFSATQGHCFPGGHASTGFVLMTGYFIYRVQRPTRAYFFFIAALILGTAMGYAQMMRGAHFFSHNLWTGWIIWWVNVCFYAVWRHKLCSSSITS